MEKANKPNIRNLKCFIETKYGMVLIINGDFAHPFGSDQTPVVFSIGVLCKFLIDEIGKPAGQHVVVHFARPAVRNLKAALLVRFSYNVLHSANRNHGVFPAHIEGEILVQSDARVHEEGPVAGLERAGGDAGGAGEAVVNLLGTHESAPSEAGADKASGAHILVAEDDGDLDVIQ